MRLDDGQNEMRLRLAERDVFARIVVTSPSPRVSRKRTMGASRGKSKTRADVVQARKPLPISASSACVSSLMIDVLPLWTLPISQTTGAKRRAASAIDGSI